MEEISDGVAPTLLATKMAIEAIARARTTTASRALTLGLNYIRELLITRGLS